MPVWSVINVSISEKGVEAKLQRIESKVDQSREISAAAERKATNAEQTSTEAKLAISQLTATLRAQNALRSLGLYNGPSDGIVGPQTVAAIQKFQAKNGLPENGKLDEKTTNALVAAFKN